MEKGVIFDKMETHAKECVVKADIGSDSYIDVTKRRQTKIALNEALTLMENRTRELNTVISAMPDGLIIFDRHGNLDYKNDIANEIGAKHGIDFSLGFIERINSTNVYTIEGEPIDKINTPLSRALKNGETTKDYIITTKNGDLIDVCTSISCAPIRNNNGEITGAVATLKDITEQKNAEFLIIQSEKRATELIEKLEKMNENMNTFLGVLSHELRNPLASIMMSLSLINDLSYSKEQAAKAIKIIERQTFQLSGLVDDLLDVTRITRNKIELKKERIELNTLVSRIVSDFSVPFREKGVRLELQISPAVKYIEADPVRITQVIENLLQNASKFTSAGDSTTIEINKDTLKGEVVISVKDTGIGMQPNMLYSLFEPFVQADNSLAHSSGGLGLGLVIVKGMVELHDGSVEVLSEGLGKGTEFIIRLPLVEDVQEVDRMAEIAYSEQQRILVIDDNPDLVEIMCELLSCIGYKVASALNGPKGIARAREFHPQIIICDIGLPGMSGYDVARSIREDNELKDVALVALSGYAQPDDLQRSKEAGFNKHLAKPVALDTLKRTLQEVS